MYNQDKSVAWPFQTMKIKVDDVIEIFKVDNIARTIN